MLVPFRSRIHRIGSVIVTDLLPEVVRVTGVVVDERQARYAQSLLMFALMVHFDDA